MAGPGTKTVMLQRQQIQPSKSFFASLFTDHPVAKVMALALALLFILLIHRELKQTLFSEPVQVVTHSSGEPQQDVLVVQAEGEFHVEVPEASRITHLVIEGINRRSDEIRRPLRVVARIPKERLQDLPPAGRDVLLEQRDLAIPGLGGLELVATPPVRVRVVPLMTRTVKLVPSRAQELQAKALEVAFDPQVVKVRGPANIVDPLGEKIEVDLPRRDPGTGIRVPWPDRHVQRNLVLVEPTELRVDIRSTDPADVEAQLVIERDVEVLIGVGPIEGADFAFGPPIELTPRMSLTLKGPKRVIDRLGANADELAELKAMLRIFAIAPNDLQGQISKLEPGATKDLTFPTEPFVPHEVFERWQLKAEPSTEVHVIVTRRAPAAKDAESGDQR